MKLGVKFNLPFRFLDEDHFEFFVRDKFVIVEIKLVQNFDGAEKIMGMEITTSGQGAKVDMDADYHGLVNFTSVKMELSDKSDCTMECYLDKFGDKFEYVIKVTCMQVLNILARTVRHVTNNYWIRYINLRDIVNFQVFDLSTNPPQACISINPSHGYSFPNFNISAQSATKNEIDRILREQTRIPIWKNLFLDSINYFTMSRYNESVVTVNIALESFVATHLYNKLNQQFPHDVQENRMMVIKLPKSLHEIMKKHFPKIDGRNFEAQRDLWKRFDIIRVYIRTRAMHSFTMALDEKTAYDTIHGIREIIKWIDPTVNI